MADIFRNVKDAQEAVKKAEEAANVLVQSSLANVLVQSSLSKVVNFQPAKLTNLDPEGKYMYCF